MKRISWSLVLFVPMLVLCANWIGCDLYPSPFLISKNPVSSYEGKEEEDLSSVQVPIPEKDRVPNKTGIQGVWSSIETLARYCGEKKLYEITENNEYKSYAGPGSARRMFEKYEIEYEMTTSTKDRSLLIKGCMVENRGCGFGIPGHVMTMVHYDEEKGVVKYIDNSDLQLKIRMWSMDEFNRRWDGWVFIIRAKNDRISARKDIPIKDRGIKQGSYDKNYIFFPN